MKKAYPVGAAHAVIGWPLIRPGAGADWRRKQKKTKSVKRDERQIPEVLKEKD
jgi:hypothetical protein